MPSRILRSHATEHQIIIAGETEIGGGERAGKRRGRRGGGYNELQHH